MFPSFEAPPLSRLIVSLGRLSCPCRNKRPSRKRTTPMTRLTPPSTVCASCRSRSIEIASRPLLPAPPTGSTLVVPPGASAVPPPVLIRVQSSPHGRIVRPRALPNLMRRLLRPSNQLFQPMRHHLPRIPSVKLERRSPSSARRGRRSTPPSPPSRWAPLSMLAALPDRPVATLDLQDTLPPQLSDHRAPPIPSLMPPGAVCGTVTALWLLIPPLRLPRIRLLRMYPAAAPSHHRKPSERPPSALELTAKNLSPLS
mmetsp:Transcript_18347/g.52515  ORF Transcript_18347/g.52515 Transcript_18347/m.52515 type:complete len:256 (-) Transcript_18347:2067-2834(-)